MTSYEDLESKARELNRSSDILSERYASIDKLIKKLNLGVEAEVEGCASCFIGYRKINGRWGLSIRTNDGAWLVTDAPRMHRIHALDRIDLLFDALREVADGMTRDIKSAIVNANMVVDVMQKVLDK
jgi:hypothetical protein